MAKDPAFLFYSSDFLAGTQFFTDEQIGQYMRLLCLQHQQGHLQEKHMLFICKTRDNDVILKFIKDEQGLYYNERLEVEVNKRKSYSESRSKNRNSVKEIPLKPKPVKKKKTSKSYVLHMENENEDINEDEIGNENGDNKPPVEILILPFDSSNFLSMWQRWKTYKQEQHKFTYKSISTEQAAVNDLTKLSGGMEAKAIEIILQSIAKGWKGFFELQNNNQNVTGNTANKQPTGGNVNLSSAFAKISQLPN